MGNDEEQREGLSEMQVLTVLFLFPRFTISFFIFVTVINKSFYIMTKGPEKNTKNKALHTKLLNRKKAKLQEEKKEKALRLKALVTKMNQKKSNDESDSI
ncbi:hypothetical protein ACM55K_02720 [Flavobacterium sp. LT1R49]|uniref:hypothetical protein n=1 Tax=Flavobacterium arabinosi TaxID=3398737 RepID=UPI003A897E4C